MLEQTLIRPLQHMSPERLRSAVGDSLQEYMRTPDDLLRLERLAIVAIIHSNNKHKLQGAVTEFGRGTADAGVNILWDLERTKESLVQHHPEVANDTPISMIKATRHYPEDGRRLDNIADYLDLLAQVSELDRQDRLAAGRARAGQDEKEIGLNEFGRFAFSMANDVMVYIIGDNGREEGLFQCRELKTREQHYGNLQRQIGCAREVCDPQSSVHFLIHDTLAIQELGTGIGAYRQRRRHLFMRPVTNDFLNAFVYGLQDSDHPVSQELASKFSQIWSEYKEVDRDEVFKGWRAGTGVDIDLLSKINGGIPQQCPFFRLVIESIDATTNDGGEEFDRAYLEIKQIVSGYPTGFQSLLRHFMQFLTDPERLEVALHTDEAEKYRRLANRLRDDYGRQIMAPDWIDLTDVENKAGPLDLYLRTLMRYFAADN